MPYLLIFFYAYVILSLILIWWSTPLWPPTHWWRCSPLYEYVAIWSPHCDYMGWYSNGSVAGFLLLHHLMELAGEQPFLQLIRNGSRINTSLLVVFDCHDVHWFSLIVIDYNGSYFFLLISNGYHNCFVVLFFYDFHKL